MKPRKTWTWTWGKMRPDKAATYAGLLKRLVGSFEEDVPYPPRKKRTTDRTWVLDLPKGS
jgi:hypothetical protein